MYNNYLPLPASVKQALADHAQWLGIIGDGAPTQSPARFSAVSPMQRFHMKNADLRHAWLAGAVCDGIDWYGANLDKVVAQGVYAGGADLWSASARWGVWDGAYLHQARMTDASFEGSSLRGARLDCAIAVRAVFLRSNLSGASMREADFKDADLQFADLRRADLTGSNLTDANMFGADVRGALIPRAHLGKNKSFILTERIEDDQHLVALQGSGLYFGRPVVEIDYPKRKTQQLQILTPGRTQHLTPRGIRILEKTLATVCMKRSRLEPWDNPGTQRMSELFASEGLRKKFLDGSLRREDIVQ